MKMMLHDNEKDEMIVSRSRVVKYLKDLHILNFTEHPVTWYVKI